MKRLLFILVSVYSLSVCAFERRFDDSHYRIVPSSANTREPVSAISSFNDNLLFTRDGRVYMGKVNGSVYDVSKCTEQLDLTALHIDGRFTQFGNNTIYYSSEGVLYQAVLANGVWSSPTELEMSGYASGRVMGEGSSLAHRRWGFKPKSRAKEKMYNPTLGDKGRRLYFSSSELPGGKGGLDIWYIERNSDNKTWSAPINYEAVNSPADEDFPEVLGDTLFCFSSNRECKSRGYNLYKKRLKGDKSLSLMTNGFNSDADDKNLVVVLHTPFFLTDRSGSVKIYRPEFYDVELQSLIEEEDDHDHVKSAVKVQKLTMKGRTCTFSPEFDGKRLAAHYDDEFDLIFQFVNDPPDCRIEIIGYADDEGSDDHNMALSLHRASLIMDKLVEMGVDERRIIYRGEGNAKPVIPGAKTEQEHRVNRRIEIIKK